MRTNQFELQKEILSRIPEDPFFKVERVRHAWGSIFDIEAQGLSPSLHRARFTWSVNVPSLDVDDVICNITSFFEMQRHRSNALLASGQDPMEGAKSVDHIMVDSVLLAYATHRAVRETLEFIMHRMREKSPLDGSKSTFDVDDIWCIMEPGEGLNNPTAFLEEQTRWGGYNGSELKLWGEFPETVMTRMIGRRVGEIVSMEGPDSSQMAPLLDRVIESADRCRFGKLRLKTKPDWVPLT